MIRKLVLLGAMVWLGKKAYDALLAAEAAALPLVRSTPFNPVLDPEAAAELRQSLREGTEATDPV